MSHPSYAALDDWITRESIPFDVDSPASFDAAVDTLIAALGGAVDLLGFGETLHGGANLLTLRNRLFQRLVEAHGFSAIAIESSFPRGHIVNDYIAGRGPNSYDAVQDAGFSHGFGPLDANRELVEWMRRTNAESSRAIPLRFYGFDSPTEMTGTDSPRQTLQFALDYLASVDPASAQTFQERIEPLLGQDADWENPAALMDPAQSIGLSPAAAALRVATEDLISELHIHRPAWIAASGHDRYWQAGQHAVVARQLLNYHAELARHSTDRTARLLGIRDAMMAGTLASIVAHERDRGKVLAFAHNSHLKRGSMQWQLGPDLLTWWPAGSHLDAMFGSHYAVVGTVVGVSESQGIGQPEPGTLEAKLIAAPGPARFIPTHRGQGLPASEIADLPTRSGSTANSSYFPLTSQSVTDFDWWAVLDSI